MIRIVSKVSILDFLREIDHLFKTYVVGVEEVVHLEDLEGYILQRMNTKNLIIGERVKLSLVELFNSTIEIGPIHVCQVSQL